MNLYREKDQKTLNEMVRSAELSITCFAYTLKRLGLMSSYEFDRIETKYMYGIDTPPAKVLY